MFDEWLKVFKKTHDNGITKSKVGSPGASSIKQGSHSLLLCYLVDSIEHIFIMELYFSSTPLYLHS